MEIEELCCFCNYFLSDVKDFETGLGVCLLDEAFDPYIDIIVESSSFACCADLYGKKRFNGDSVACMDFKEAEFIDLDDDNI